jgi:methyl-accepting chemotaxis protein
MVEETNALTHKLSDEAANMKTQITLFQLGDAPKAAPVQRAASKARPLPADEGSEAVASPARSMMGNIARAFSAKSNLATSPDEWEEF